MLTKLFARRNRRQPARGSGPALLARIPWRAGAFALLLGAGLVAIALLLAVALDRPVQRVLVEGSFQRVSPLEIERAVLKRVRGGLASVDLEAVRQEVETIPWVDRALVERRWPDAVHVVISEQVAVARWRDDGLVNARGELFVRNPRFVPPELPLLDGPDGRETEVAELYLGARGRLLESGLRLTGVRLDERGAWELTVGDGVTVRLGRQSVAGRVERFIALASPMVAKRLAEIDYVDMRYTHGFSVGWASRPALAVAPREDATPDG